MEEVLGLDLATIILEIYDSNYTVQFPDVVTFADEMAEKGKIVIVAALDGTFQKKVIIKASNGVICSMLVNEHSSIVSKRTEMIIFVRKEGLTNPTARCLGKFFPLVALVVF